VADFEDHSCADARCRARWRERWRGWERRERDLTLDRAAAWKASSCAHERAARLAVENAGLKDENRRLSARVAELESVRRGETAAGATSAGATAATPVVPDFVKANVPAKSPKKPGRKAGHPAALRPMPRRIDRVVEVPLARDDRGRELCPECRCVLTAVRGHARVVEDLTPVNVEAVKYKTRSGMCIKCDCRRESRAREQPPPPAGDVPHGQLGLNALAIGVMLRVRHRLPVRQICRVPADMAGLRVSPGALVKQVLRVSRHLEREYEELLPKMRASNVIHVDETGWRLAGKNAWAWVFTQPLLTLFVPDASRGGKVAGEILGEAFGGTVVSDFYSAYNTLTPAGGKQRSGGVSPEPSGI
jgi:transposase